MAGRWFAGVAKTRKWRLGVGLLVPADAPRRGGEGGGVAGDGGGAYVLESVDGDVAAEEVRRRASSRRSKA